ncbi:MAG: hypothetical protein Q7T20_12790 [Saprospiraceae bacterium]|nr:hypothetical protein [Saprospiraceae bacterium]
MLMDFLQEVFTSPKLNTIFPGKIFGGFSEVAGCTNHCYAVLLNSHKNAKQLSDSFHPNRRLGFVAFALYQMSRSVEDGFDVPPVI